MQSACTTKDFSKNCTGGAKSLLLFAARKFAGGSPLKKAGGKCADYLLVAKEAEPTHASKKENCLISRVVTSLLRGHR
jgi:hypothetical protein